MNKMDSVSVGIVQISYNCLFYAHLNMILLFMTEKTRFTTIYLFSYVCCRYNKSNG